MIIQDYITGYLFLAMICFVLVPVFFDVKQLLGTFNEDVTEFIQTQAHLPIHWFVLFTLAMCTFTICLLVFAIIISPFLFTYLIFRKNNGS
jgi:uncharacterized membrane protein YbhN (UPF0104 family)